MTTKARSERKATDDWNAARGLYDKLLYWLYDQDKPLRACPYARRLASLLQRLDPEGESVFAEECRSLIHEALGDLTSAIRHRENEIALIRRLQQVAKGRPFERYALRDYLDGDLSDRLDLLAILYRASGDLNKAIQTLQESRQLCKDSGVKFDAADVLQGYLRESESKSIPVVTRVSIMILENGQNSVSVHPLERIWTEPAALPARVVLGG